LLQTPEFLDASTFMQKKFESKAIVSLQTPEAFGDEAIKLLLFTFI
jgi:hypothetical protein